MDMTSTVVLLEDEWLVVESQRTAVIFIKTQYGVIAKKIYNQLFRHPLVNGVKYRVEVYTKGSVVFTNKNYTLRISYNKSGGCFWLEFEF